ncbi:MAG: adenylate/guanylate cyclase domain-containing protein [Gammaproteobacteria bacterium]|nr:adenylate/guanylate cyclase domain-containing protein [Gammaproteobacteria bacterium]
MFKQVFNQSLKQKFPFILGLLLVCLLFYINITDNRSVNLLLNRLEWLVYDYRMQLTHYEVAKAHDKVIIVNIDNKSLQDIGRWPWSREVMADLTQKVFDLGINVVSYDIQFSEKETINSPYLNSKIKQLRKEGKNELADELFSVINNRQGDNKLAQVFSENDVVLGFTFHSDSNHKSSGTLPEAVHFASQKTSDKSTDDSTFYFHINTAASFTVPIALLNKEAHGVEQKTFNGFINANTDSDGILRKSQLFLRYHDEIYASLPLESVRLNLLADQLFTTTLNNELAYFSFSKGVENSIAVQRDGNILIPYRGSYGSFKYLSASDVLSGKIKNPGTWEIAIIGSAAPSLFDSHSIPLQPHFPGVEVQANIIAGLIDNHFPKKPEWNYLYNDLFIIIIGTLLAFLFPQMTPMRQLIISGLLLLSLVGFDYYLWKAHYYALDSVLPAFTLIFLTLFNVIYGFIKEYNKRHSIQQIFGQYIPPQVVEQLSKSDDLANTLEGERRELTVLFADIRNFTSLSETLSATELKKLLNAYFTPMTEIIFNHSGTIDKYVGDMIMAFWGAPIEDNDHASHATNTALKMLEVTDQLKPAFEQMGFPEISIGIGLNTGEMNVGNMGSIYRKAYTVLGDHVNLGSRLESLTKNYGVKLIISEYTYEKIKHTHSARLIDKVRVKGRSEALSIYEPLKLIEQMSKEENTFLSDFKNASKLYYQQKWQAALIEYSQLKEQAPNDKVLEIYTERCHQYISNPPEKNWDGIYTHLSK